jgi:hypothetical protein
MAAESFHTEHAAQQFNARYGAFTENADWIQAFLDIVEGRTLMLRSYPSGMEKHMVSVAGIDAIVIYDPSTACIITALPR